MTKHVEGKRGEIRSSNIGAREPAIGRVSLSSLFGFVEFCCTLNKSILVMRFWQPLYLFLDLFHVHSSHQDMNYVTKVINY